MIDSGLKTLFKRTTSLMEAIRKQATKFREQVAKQQQAVLKQFTGRYSNDSVLADEAEIQCFQELKKLYNSTGAAKHFQKDLVRGVEDLIYAGLKQMEIAIKLAEDCCRYGNESENIGSALASASLHFGTSHSMMERQRENLHNALDAQISEPLRAMIKGAPLEDARRLTHQYYRIRHDVEAQAAVVKRQLKSKEAGAAADSDMKLQNAELKLSALRSTMFALGKEATSAMMSVEVQQQRLTFEGLLAMVNAERSYHKSVAAILDKLHSEMVREKQHCESASKSTLAVTDVYVPPKHGYTNSNESSDPGSAAEKVMHFVAKAKHSFDAHSEGELSLSSGDYVVVRQLAANGWSEGECKGKTGWFPSAYVERCDRAPATKVIEANPSS